MTKQKQYPNDSKREASSVVAQMAYDHIQNRLMAEFLVDNDIREKEAALDPVLFLQSLRLSHGLSIKQYRVSKDDLCGVVINNGTRNWRPVEFLKQVMHFSAEEAGRIIRGEQSSMDLISWVSPYELELRASPWESETWYLLSRTVNESRAIMQFLNSVERNQAVGFNILFSGVIEVPYPIDDGRRAERRGALRKYITINAPIEAIRHLKDYGYPESGIVRSNDLHSENITFEGEWKWAKYGDEIYEGWKEWAGAHLRSLPNGKFWASWEDIRHLHEKPLGQSK